MKILVVGGGGREHALVWRLAKDGHTLLVAPGNPGMEGVAERLDIGASNVAALETVAVDRGVDLVVVGPEAPLVAGLADRLRARDILVFGPSAAGAQLEGSKIFSKEFFARHEIRSAEFVACDTVAEADAAIDELGDRVVVKADGLAAGKGVVVCSNMQEARDAARAMLDELRFGDAGKRIVIERRLVGHELSVMAITDGTRYQVLAQAEDHKQLGDGDVGPNTGGMGTVSPAPWASPELIAQVERDVLQPTLTGLAADGIDYRGVLYAGLMVDDDGVPWLLEYNCRFGDPETQPVLARLRGDFAEWLAGAAAGKLPDGSIEWDPRTAVCVVIAAANYPGTPDKGDRIDGIHEAGQLEDTVVFHAGTSVANGEYYTAGGRVLGVTVLADNLEQARERAYRAVKKIDFRGKQYRLDIGARGQETS